jgi:hypothetical protein
MNYGLTFGSLLTGYILTLNMLNIVLLNIMIFQLPLFDNFDYWSFIKNYISINFCVFGIDIVEINQSKIFAYFLKILLLMFEWTTNLIESDIKGIEEEFDEAKN